jgi:hypothetical protein
MPVATGVASAAAKRRKAGAPPLWRAADPLPTLPHKGEGKGAKGGTWLACAFRRFASLTLPEANLFQRVVPSWWWSQSSGVERHRENGCCYSQIIDNWDY